MAVAQGYGKTVTSGSVFAYDTGDTRNSYSGRPTVNVSAGLGVNNYNNVPGSVTTAITATGETYKGATVYKQTLTPLDATGVSYLTNANNPGLGVYHGGGGGTGGQYSGHTIFFKPTGPMYSAPIYTHYSNITGWQSTSNYEDMGDGWFRAKVLWYNASTLSDNKFWAINPAGAAINVPITIYWAGPFRENLNSTTISQFVEGTRSATQGLLPLVGNSTLDLTNVSFDSNAQISLDGSSDYVKIAQNSNFYTNEWAWEMVVKFTANTGTYQGLVWAEGDTGGGSGLQYLLTLYNHSYFHYRINNATTGWTNTDTSAIDFIPSNYNHIVFQFKNGTTSIYINGKVFHTDSTRGAYSGGTNSPMFIGARNDGAFSSAIRPDVIKAYTKTLSEAEVGQNYRHYKTRFNLS